MNVPQQLMNSKKLYVPPELRVKGDIATLTQSKTIGSGDAFILSIDGISDDDANVISSVTHYS